MPAHDPKLRDKEYDILLRVVEIEKWDQHVPDGHVHIHFEWFGGTRTWNIEGLLEPQSPFQDIVHNWQHYDKLPQGQGDAILNFLEFVRYLIEEKHLEDTEDTPSNIEETSIPQ